MLDLIVVSPAIVAFGLAVTTAVAWCVWLMRSRCGDGGGSALVLDLIFILLSIAFLS